MQTGYRLPAHINPKEYNIEFRPDTIKSTFSGKETIYIVLDKADDKIILNSSGLKIGSCAVKQAGKSTKTSIKVNEKNQTIIIKLGKKLERGEAELDIEFSGVLNDSLCGFYRSKYKAKDGKEKYMAVTQFEAPYARMAFPCFDEPGKKAAFDIRLIIDDGLQGISNMPVKRESVHNGKKTVEFERTPVMSTYLLFMAAGEFESVEMKQKGKTIRVITMPGKREEGRLSLDLTAKFLKYFEDYTGIAYPLPKLDMIAIPDFAAGAMENWGAITFRELLLLSDENTSVSRKRRLAEVIAHELWHMWSGDLVTMKWWNDLWLNESFADYMAYKAVDHYFPEWKIMEEFILSETEAAFGLDSMENTHPIEVVVKSANEIEEIFDSISYSKGGNVLRMVESFMGEEKFRRGVSNYLSKFSYGNAESSDLWDALSMLSDADIKAVVENWIRQPGFPIIEANREGSTLVLKQRRFSRKKHDQLWKIPLVIQTENGVVRELFDKKEMRIKIKGWFKLNQEQRGFYRVKYSDAELETLGKRILSGKMSPADRWGIQNDLFSMCHMGEIGIDKYLAFLKNYRNEDSYMVLLDIFGNLKSMYNLFSADKTFDNVWPVYRKLMLEPFEKVFRKLKWEPRKGESHENAMLRPLAIGYLGFAKNEAVLKTSMEKFSQLYYGKNVPSDLRGTIYAMIAVNFTDKFRKMLKMYERAKNLEDKQKLLAALYRFRDGRLTHMLDYALTHKVRAQDLRTVFSVIEINPSFSVLFFPWAKKNWSKLSKFQKSHAIFMNLIETMIGGCIWSSDEKAVKAFLSLKKVKYERTRRVSFEALDISKEFMKKNGPVLKKYFRNKFSR